MSKYTTEVRFICEQSLGLRESEGLNSFKDIIERSVRNIFDFDFPIFDEEYRYILCSKILKHYYTREISEETVGLWKLRLETRMNEIMPYYNRLYKSELLEFNPLYDTDLTTTHSGESTENKNTTERSESERKGEGEDSKTVGSTERSDIAVTSRLNSELQKTNSESTSDAYSDTPQGSLQNVSSNTYLTNARITNKNGQENATSTDVTNSSNVGTITNNSAENGGNKFSEEGKNSVVGTSILDGTNSYVQKVLGKSAGVSYSKLLDEFRKTFLNIDLLVIEELSDLFFGLW